MGAVYILALLGTSRRMPISYTARVPNRAKHRVQVLRPNKPEAHDEGPRLLPLPDKIEQHNTKIQHYMKLANLALRAAPSKRNQ